MSFSQEMLKRLNEYYAEVYTEALKKYEEERKVEENQLKIKKWLGLK